MIMHSEETGMIMQPTSLEECYQCLGNIISRTTPADACRLSLVSTRFKDEAESDQVWEKFLPSQHLVRASESQFTSSSTFVPAKSKKEFYFALCDNPVLIDKRKMSSSLDNRSGKKCYMICARELYIFMGGDTNYWNWISLAEFRLEKVAAASLDRVCLLDIRGKIDTSILSPRTLYKAYLVYKFREGHYGFDVPVEVAVAERHYGFEYRDLNTALGGDVTTRIVYLDPSLEIMDGAQRPRERADGWLEVELGEFRCQAEEDGELEMICAAYQNRRPKMGLIVQGIEVRPEGERTTSSPKARQDLHNSQVKRQAMSFSLDKWSGKICYMICARELYIAWGADKRYWKWISLAESRFEKVAFLDKVCLIEIRGKIDMSILSPRTLYKAYLVYKLEKRHYGFDVRVEVAVAERHHGFEYGDLNTVLGGDVTTRIAYLDPSLEIVDGAQRPKGRADGWLEVELGEFLCQAEEDGELEMICVEPKHMSYWKGGLIVQGIEVRPERERTMPGQREGTTSRPKARQEDHISEPKVK